MRTFAIVISAILLKFKIVIGLLIYSDYKSYPSNPYNLPEELYNFNYINMTDKLKAKENLAHLNIGINYTEQILSSKNVFAIR